MDYDMRHEYMGNIQAVFFLVNFLWTMFRR